LTSAQSLTYSLLPYLTRGFVLLSSKEICDAAQISVWILLDNARFEIRLRHNMCALAEARFGFAITLMRLHRYQGARDRLTEGMRAYPAQPPFARALARLMAAAPDDRVRDTRQAMTLTQRLLEQQQTVDLVETMAMTLANLGQYTQAATVQRQVMAAASKAGHAVVVKELAENLARYERNEPCRTPLRTDDPVEIFELRP
jgi:hypothetical protein